MVKYPEGSVSPALLLGDDYYWGVLSGLYDLFTKDGTRKIGMYLDGAAILDRINPIAKQYPPELVGKELVGDERADAINSEATRLWVETIYMTGAYR